MSSEIFGRPAQSQSIRVTAILLTKNTKAGRKANFALFIKLSDGNGIDYKCRHNKVLDKSE